MKIRRYIEDSFRDFKTRHTMYVPALVCAIMLLLALSGPIYRAIAPTGANIYLTVSVMEILTVALPCMIFVRLREGGESEAMGFHTVSGDSIFFVLLTTLAMLTGGMAISAAGAHLGIIESSGYTLYESYGLPSGGTSNTALAVLTFAFIPALCEEFLFRGVIMSEYSKDGIVTSLTVSSLLFAIIHFNLGKFPVYLFCGLMLGFIRLLTHSLLASFLAHFIYNLMGVFAQGFFSKVTEQLSEFLLIFFIGIGAFLLLMFLAFGEADRICNRYAKMGAPLPDGADPITNDGSNFFVKIGKSISKNASALIYALLSPMLIIGLLAYIIISLIL